MSFNNFNKWKLKPTADEHDIIDVIINNNIENLFLLDINKLKFSVLEKYVYEIAKFHGERLGIKNMLNQRIIFSFGESIINNKLKIDLFKNTPLTTTITYMTTSSYPTIFTNIDSETYKYKEFINKNSICVSFPKKFNHISFDDYNCCVGDCKIDKFCEETMNPKLVLKVLLFEDVVENIPFFECNDNLIDLSDNILVICENNNNTKTASLLNSKYSDFELYEEMCYAPNNETYNFLGDIIFNDVLENNIEIFNFNYCLETKIIENDYADNKTKIDVTRPCFLKRDIIKTHYSAEICDWIINECEITKLSTWQESAIENCLTEELDIEKIPYLLRLFLQSISNISQKIKEFYSLSDNCVINIVSLFIKKYKSDSENSIELKKNNRSFVINILLSNETDFENEGFVFDNNEIFKINQGDVVIYSGNTENSFLKLKKGVQYSLIVLLDAFE